MNTSTKFAITAFAGIIFLSFNYPPDFLTQQKKFERVRTAINEKQIIIDKKLSENKITLNKLNILFIAYKDQDQLEVYAKNKLDSVYKKIHTYEICSRSGNLGPKRKQGDFQVPEGFYHIDRFNPSSNYYLSLGLNYPNQSDKLKSTSDNLGGDIFIHGSCVTIGCLPMTHENIKEIYLLAVHAKNNGQNEIPVYVFPFKMSEQNMTTYKTKYKSNPGLISFWENLYPGYNKFIKTHQELKTQIDKNGNYKFD